MINRPSLTAQTGPGTPPRECPLKDLFSIRNSWKITPGLPAQTRRLSGHDCHTWQRLPDYGPYPAAFIANPALPGKWQPGEEVAYILLFEGDLTDRENPDR